VNSVVPCYPTQAKLGRGAHVEDFSQGLKPNIPSGPQWRD
jgi:hypothetical protein